MLNNCLYVDDLYYGAESVEEAYSLSTNAKRILGEAKMKLRKFKTNSEELRNLWNEGGIGLEEETFDNETPMLLGIVWDNRKDKLKLHLDDLMDEQNRFENTKRYVLKTAAQIFDPIGFISPFTIRVKCLFQKLWQRGLEWDEELPPELGQEWQNWCSEIKKFNNLYLNRKYFPQGNFLLKEGLQLHVFGDASPAAYGAVAYFRAVDNQSEISTSFIMSKSRVAPVKNLTLPRLELMGAIIVARMVKYLRRLFDIKDDDIFLWTDSSITLQWIRGSPRDWKPFISNRVTEIQACTDPQNWRYCDGKNNPADLLTRGVKAENLENNNCWWYGPPWLSQPKHTWPQKFNNAVLRNEMLEDIQGERKLNANKVFQLSCKVEVYPDPVMEIKKFSSLTKLYRVTAWILRFIYNCRKDVSNIKGSLSVEEMSRAEIYWIKCTQRSIFVKEINNLINQKPIDKESKLWQLNPKLDEHELLCLKGRLQFSQCSEMEKHPWILPEGTKFTELVIWSAHNKVLHSGINATLLSVRERFWVLKGRQFVKSVLNKCMICKRYKVRPGVQTIAPLPADRTIIAPPFTITGLDFAGPLYAKGTENKYYILIFTCAVTRAIHIELVTDLTTETFLLGFRRFIARRGLCRVIYSDNAQTFKRADVELQGIWKSINHPQIKEFFCAKGLEWKFIVQKGAWWGGFWERMIRNVKTTLRKILGRASLSAKELETVLIEIEAVINSRPLTYIYNVPDEPYPLTPAHLLTGKELITLPSVRLATIDLNAGRKLIVKRYNYLQKLLDMFWKRWKRDYLLNLRSVNCSASIKETDNFKIGDIVLIGDDRFPRNMWKLGKITNVYVGRDKNVRSCEIKTERGIIKRPIQLIYNLELTN